MKRILVVLLALSLLLSMAVTVHAEEKPVLTVGKAVDTSSMTFPEGVDVEHNYYIDYAEYKSGVDIQFEWCLADDEQKISLAIGSKQIPDVMIVNQTVFNTLIKNDMIMDLTDVYAERAAGTLLERVYGIFPECLDAATVDGKLMALPETYCQYAQAVCWIRQDWLEKCSLDAPETLEDLENVMKAFIEMDPDGNGEDDTIGIAVAQENITKYAHAGTMNPIFMYFGSYPAIWYENDDGEVVYGTVQPQTKEALAYLQKLYADGIIDPEFCVREVTEPVVAGKCGVIFGDWSCTLHILKESHLFDGADWNAYVCPQTDAGVVQTRFQPPCNNYLVVSKDCKNPEAVIDILNASYSHLWDLDIEPEWQAKFDEYEGYSVGWQTIPIPLQLEQSSIVEERYEAYRKYIEEGSREGNSAAVDGFIDGYIKYINGEDEGGWTTYTGCFKGGGAAISEKNVYEIPCYSGTTPTMESKWVTLQTMEDETIIKIVLGEASIDEFDTFVENWYLLGGETITEEVADIVG